MKRFLMFAAAVALCAFTVYAIHKVDINTKNIAGFLDSNVFFDIQSENGQTVITILNDKIRLR